MNQKLKFAFGILTIVLLLIAVFALTCGFFAGIPQWEQTGVLFIGVAAIAGGVRYILNDDGPSFLVGVILSIMGMFIMIAATGRPGL